MRILITGSAGFVGHHFKEYFASGNHEVVEIDLKLGTDCRDFFKMNHERFDLVVHLAAIVGGRETIESQPLTVASDLSIDAEFFNWVVSTGQERVIYFSSSAAYPVRLQDANLRHQLSEDDINLDAIENPDMTYGWAKLTGEFLAQFARKQGTKVHVLRPFSGYGWNQDASYPFPAFIDRAIRKDNPFHVWGSGEQVRDFIHISDVVEGSMKVVELEIQEPINLGNGIPVSFNDLAENVFRVSGWRPTEGILRNPEKPSGVSFRCADVTRMVTIFRPKVSLEDGIEEALRLREEHGLAINH